MEFTLDYLVKDAILWGVFVVFTDCWVFGLPRVGLAGLDRQNIEGSSWKSPWIAWLLWLEFALKSKLPWLKVFDSI